MILRLSSHMVTNRLHVCSSPCQPVSGIKSMAAKPLMPFARSSPTTSIIINLRIH